MLFGASVFMASTAADDTAFAWAFVLAIPLAWLSLILYVPGGISIICAGIRRYLKVGPVLLGLVLPPVLTILMVQCREGPGWLFLLAVLALPIACAYQLWSGLAAVRRARRQISEATPNVNGIRRN